jgi:hypothetical protein
MQNDYIFVTDMDNAHSIRDKKQLLYYRFSDIRDGAIVVVIKEIESWYYAGLSPESAHALGVHSFPSTDEMSKEDFNQLIPRKFDSRIDFMYEILKYYSVGTAALRNRSFGFFVSRYQLSADADASSCQANRGAAGPV